MAQMGASTGRDRSRRKVRCRTVATSVSKQMNYVRELAPLVTEEQLGELDDVPVATSSEMLLAAMGSCLSARIYANAAAANMKVFSLELEVEADDVVSTLWEPLGTRPRSIGFDAITVIVNMDADASPEALRALIAHALLWSPVANTIHDPVHLDVRLGRTSSMAGSGIGSRDLDDA